MKRLVARTFVRAFIIFSLVTVLALGFAAVPTLAEGSGGGPELCLGCP